MTKTTQLIHKIRVAEPLEIYFNLEAGWLSISVTEGDQQKEVVIPLMYLIPLIVALGKILERWQVSQIKDDGAIRSVDSDEINAEWQAANWIAGRIDK